MAKWVCFKCKVDNKEIETLRANNIELKYERDNLFAAVGIMDKEIETLRDKSAAYDEVMGQEIAMNQQGKVMDKQLENETILDAYDCLWALRNPEEATFEKQQIAMKAIEQAFDKAEKFDAMVEAGPVRYESRIVYSDDYKGNWIDHTRYEFKQVKEKGTRFCKPLETRELYALPSQEKCDG